MSTANDALVSAVLDQDIERVVRALAGGADPNARHGEYRLPLVYFVTGERENLAIATRLLDAGANPTDEESMYHAAEHYHVGAMELLLARGCDLNHVGEEYGNTPLHFLLRWYPLDKAVDARRGAEWLLAHGADPNVRCGQERESALHIAARRGQSPDVTRLLLAHGADANAERSDGATPWLLATRSGFDSVAQVLEESGAERRSLSDADLLLRACSAGDADEARRRARPELRDVVNTRDENGATGLHYAAFTGQTRQVQAWIAAGADLELRDNEHDSTPLGWATWAREHNPQPGADYESTIAALTP